MLKQCLKCLKPLTGQVNHYGLHLACFLKWFQVKEPMEFTNLARKTISQKSGDISETSAKQSSFFHGKFRKYSATLGNSSYLLKVKDPVAPELPDVEYLSNQIGELLGIPIAHYYFIEFLGERVFVTKNFVEMNQNSSLNHIYHYQQDKKIRDCETLINIISEETKRFIDIEIFIKVCLFDALIGNHDRHGRNLGFLITPQGTTLAPIYDNPSALGLESGDWLKADFDPKGRIPTKNSEEPTAKEYVQEFKRLGYNEQVQHFVKNLNIKKIHALIKKSFCSNLMKQALEKLIQKRIEEIYNEVSK